MDELQAVVREAFHAEDPAVSPLFAGRDEWTISQPLGQLLTHLVLRLNRRSILEFGAGVSSIVLADALRRIGGGRLTSVEHEPQYSMTSWQEVMGMGIDAHLERSSLRLRLSSSGLFYTYAGTAAALAARAPYDFVLIDAPPGRFGRDAPMYQAYRYLAPGAVIVLDDASRPQERTAIRRWLAAYPGLRLVALEPTHGRGTAVLVHSGDKRQRISVRSLLGSIHDRWHVSR